jgi:DnaJ-class molecular chaperone
MMQSTYYQILGVSVTASPAEIRRRYRELARTHHPDVSGDRLAGHQEFLAISEAYQVLSDPLRRAEYDRELVLGAR